MNSERPDNPENPENPGSQRSQETPETPENPDEGTAAPDDEATTTEEPLTEGDGEHVVEPGAPARPRRRPSRAIIASVAAAVLLTGGGGAYLAATASGGSDGSGSRTPGGDGTPPPLALDGYTEGDPNGIAPGEPDPGGVTYRADGELPDGPDSAPVYKAKGEVTAAEVARLAKALGVEGKPVAEDGFWQVGSTADGSGPGLRVSVKAPGQWTFNRSLPGGDNCQKVEVCASGTTAEGSAEGSGDASADVDPVSEAAAKKVAARVLKAVGQDDAKIDASGLTGTVRVVNADPEIGGLPTYGWVTGVQVGPDGQVAGGSGTVKVPVKSDTYPVVDAERALELLNDSGRTVGIGGCASAVPAESEDTDSLCEPSTTLPKPEPVAVRKAVFGLASHFVDGKSALVPSWLFEVRPKGAEESFTVTQPAVAPEYLAAPDPLPTPSGEPEPVPSNPGDDPTSGPSSHNVKVEGYEADGDQLTVSFWGGVCSDYSATAEEDGDKVTVTVTATPWKDKVCIMIAKVVERTVTLDKPLGDREVVGSDGRKIPAGGLELSELQPQ